MNTFIIKNSVIVEPQYLDKNIDLYLNKKVKEDFIGKCFKDYGYIIDVIKILNYTSRITSSDSIIVFDLEFEIISLFPEVGKIYKTVSFVNAFSFDQFKGSLFNLYETVNNDVKSFIQVFVTNVDKNEEKLSFIDCGCVINCNNINSPLEIDVLVEQVVYKNGKFCIIGKHVH
jgi:hypothetical protein